MGEFRNPSLTGVDQASKECCAFVALCFYVPSVPYVLCSSTSGGSNLKIIIPDVVFRKNQDFPEQDVVAFELEFKHIATRQIAA